MSPQPPPHHTPPFELDLTKLSSDQPGAGWTNGDFPTLLYPSTVRGKLELYQHHRRWIGLHRSWSRIGADHTELSARTSSSAQGASLVTDLRDEGRRVRALMAQLCEMFYHAGWATGTGGGICVRVGGPAENRPWRVFVAPSGLQKEDLIGEDMFELDMDRNVVEYPQSNPQLRQSACTPLWYVVYRLRPSATAVLHTHSVNAVYATLIDKTETSRSIKLTHLEMLKGVGNHAYDDVLEIPIIDNRPTEDLLAEQLEAAIQAYPKTNAVLVRRHGLYVWGDSWEQCKTHAESIDYLLQCAVQMRQMGIDPGMPPASGTYRVDGDNGKHHAEDAAGPPQKKLKTAPPTTTGFNGNSATDNDADCHSNAVPLLPRDGKRILLLDIEGCTTSIAFVKDVLFPYVRKNLTTYLAAHVQDETAQQQLRQGLTEEVNQVLAKNGDEDKAASPDFTSIESLVTFLMDRDVKSATLKDLQGKMWQVGYASGELQGHVYADFKPMLEWMTSKQVTVGIYSSGSVQAQKLIFGHSNVGDLLPFLSHHFDIPAVGNKKEASSYRNIAKSLGVEPQDIVFVSDSEDELVAAREAGIGHAVMSIRPGNVPLTEIGHTFPAIYSLLQLCGE